MKHSIKLDCWWGGDIDPLSFDAMNRCGIHERSVTLTPAGEPEQGVCYGLLAGTQRIS